MTITIHPDIVGDTSVSQSADGYTATRGFIAQTTAGETIVDILAHDGIPQYAEIHPDFDGISLVPIYALNRTCSPVNEDNTVYKVIIDYRRPSAATAEPSELEADAIIRLGSSVTGSKTEVDKDDTQITVTLTTATPTTQTGSVDIQVPETVIEFTRREPASPRSKARTYVGKVNSASLGDGDYAIGTLLCLGIEGETTDGGESYNVTYRFQYRPKTWVATVVYIDPETDRPHDDVDIAGLDGVTYADIYDEANFASLNLPWTS